MTTFKLKLARGMMTKVEREKGVKPFLSSAWEARTQAVIDRVKRKQGEAHARAIIRKQNNKKKPPTKKELQQAKKLLQKSEAKKARNIKYINKLKKK